MLFATNPFMSWFTAFPLILGPYTANAVLAMARTKTIISLAVCGLRYRASRLAVPRKSLGFSTTPRNPRGPPPMGPGTAYLQFFLRVSAHASSSSESCEYTISR